MFKGSPNVFGNADDIFIVEYDADSKDHNKTLRQVMLVYGQENINLNKSKCHFKCPSIPVLEK